MPMQISSSITEQVLTKAGIIVLYIIKCGGLGGHNISTTNLQQGYAIVIFLQIAHPLDIIVMTEQIASGLFDFFLHKFLKGKSTHSILECFRVPLLFLICMHETWRQWKCLFFHSNDGCKGRML